MKYPVIFSIIIVSVMITIISQSMGVSGLDGGQLAPIDPPIDPLILTSLPGSNLDLWTNTTDPTPIIYDRWNIILYGDPGDSFSVEISGKEIFSGILSGSYTNLSYYAADLFFTVVQIQVGMNNWTIPNIIVIHSDIGYEGPLEENNLGGRYGKIDLTWAQIRASIGATILALVSVWITRKVLQYNDTRQGVIQI